MEIIFQNELVNGATGIYAAQTFAENHARDWSDIDEDDLLLLLQDPTTIEDESYFETWDRVQNNASRIDENGVKLTLHQDEHGNVWEVAYYQHQDETQLEGIAERAYSSDFMKPDFEAGYVEVNGDCGTDYLPFSLVGIDPDKDDVRDYVESSEIEEINVNETGYLWRLSADGFMDATDWNPCESYREALIEAIEEKAEIDAQTDE